MGIAWKEVKRLKRTLKAIFILIIFVAGFYLGVRVGEYMTKQKMAEILNVNKSKTENIEEVEIKEIEDTEFQSTSDLTNTR